MTTINSMTAIKNKLGSVLGAGVLAGAALLAPAAAHAQGFGVAVQFGHPAYVRPVPPPVYGVYGRPYYAPRPYYYAPRYGYWHHDWYRGRYGYRGW